jgi:hypothetical protein
MPIQLVTAAANEDMNVPSAAGRLTDLGFLSSPDLPDRPGPAFLLVALRDVPTLRHYDPERVDYWVTSGSRGVRASLTRATTMPIDTEFSWGLIRLVDRVPVTNEYLTFGGRLSAAQVDDATIAAFTSPAPLLRRGGHSQLWDDGADLLGAYFARLVGAIDVRPRLEERLCQVDPRARYAAFLGDVVGRYRRSPSLRAEDARAWTLLQSEETRLRRDAPDAWRTGSAILAEIGRTGGVVEGP